MWWLKGMNLNEIPNDRKWYAVETAFVDGELLDSKCCFVEDGSSIVGVQIASHTEAPGEIPVERNSVTELKSIQTGSRQRNLRKHLVRGRLLISIILMRIIRLPSNPH